ncbi:unnamed protein product [Schistosoma bovis]|nr:unnamed protein product [Schistosoma bovis]CAH8638232.1 unnamed protein product [Schistosoma bovis]
MDPAKLELLLEQQLKLMQMLMETKVTPPLQPSTSSSTTAPSVDGIANSIAEFHYDPDSNVTSEMWFRRYEDLFKFDFANQDDAWKVRLLLRKLGANELDKYCNLILPLNPRDRSFADTVQTLIQHFGDNSSLFNTRYRCLKLTMNEDDDFLTHVGVVNRECERFRLKSLTEDQFKALILICSLQHQKFSDLRTRLLSRLDQEPKLTLSDIANEYQRLLNLQRDTSMVQSGGSSRFEVRAVQQTPHKNKHVPASSSPSHSSSRRQTKATPPAPCWQCGAWHYVRNCPFKQHRCKKCKVIGHKDGFCLTKKTPSQSRNTNKTCPRSRTSSLSLVSSCQSSSPSQRKFITVNINGHPSRLQVDTASDVTILSRKYWIRMGRPHMVPTTQKPRTACGNYLRLLGQLDCKVSFHDSTFTGVCYITPADLNLLGLDWFDQLHLADVPLSTVCHLVKQPHEPETYSKELLTEFSTSEHHTAGEDTVIASLMTKDYAQCYLTTAIRALPVSAAEIQSASNNDSIIKRAMKYVTNGWPPTGLDGDLKQLYRRRDSLCVVNECLMFGDRVVVPESLRSKVLKQFHTGHPGIKRMKSIARSYAYWPLMDQHIVDLVSKCTQCQQAVKCNAKILPVPWPQPEYPWSRIHVDFAGPINGITYLVVVDAFSKWPEINPIIPPTTTKTIQILTEIFSRNGIPDAIVSDNGSQFTSSQFQSFCQRLAIKHLRSPPYHPQSNGQAERFVDTFKRALAKTKGEGTPADALQNFLYVYRTTPNETLPERKSPAEILMGRSLKTIHSLMHPRNAPTPVRTKFEKQSTYEVGCPVFARDYRPTHSPWTEARVVKRVGRVMYEVEVGSDRWQRHRNQLRKRLAPDRLSTESNIPLDILLDTFNLPATPPPEKPQQQTETRPRRWPIRERRATIRMQVDPRKARY